MRSPEEKVPARAVAGLSEILLALGDELRAANREVGEHTWRDETGQNIREPILFLNGASVELAVTVTASASGGVKVWVVNTEAGVDYERSGKITVQLNTGSEPFGVGM